MSTPLLPVLTTLFTLTFSANSADVLGSGDAEKGVREAIHATAGQDTPAQWDARAAREADEPQAPVMLALELGRLGDDDVTQRDRRRLGTSDRVFGPVHPTSRLGSYTGRGLGSYTGRGLGSYTGSGLGGSTTNGTGAATGARTR